MNSLAEQTNKAPLPLSAAGPVRAPLVRRQLNHRRDNDPRDSRVLERGSTVSASSETPPSRRRTIARRELLMVVTQLSIMLRSGVDLADAVRSISRRAKSDSVRDVMSRVYAKLEQGQRLSIALEGEQKSFGAVMVALVAAGEASGKLPDVLARLSTMLRDEIRMMNSIRSSLGYPVVLLVVTIAVMAGMVFFVLPQFAGIFESSKAEVPFITQLMLDGGQFARNYWWAIAATLSSSLYGLFAYTKTKAGREMLDRLMISIPYVKGISASLVAGRLFRLQGAMLDSGVPMLDVLALSKATCGNTCYQNMLDQIEESVIKGEGFSTVLRDNPLVPGAVADMISTGEANGQLGPVLQTVGEFYETEGEEKLRDAVKIAEPVIIIGLGIVVGGVVLSIMLPMLDITTATGV
jgi:type IV pilus assembly protein PilC